MWPSQGGRQADRPFISDTHPHIRQPPILHLPPAELALCLATMRRMACRLPRTARQWQPAALAHTAALRDPRFATITPEDTAFFRTVLPTGYPRPPAWS